MIFAQQVKYPAVMSRVMDKFACWSLAMSFEVNSKTMKTVSKTRKAMHVSSRAAPLFSARYSGVNDVEGGTMVGVEMLYHKQPIQTVE